MNENFIENATLVYLKAYDVAMKKVKNQQLAILAAMSVTNNYMTIHNPEGKREVQTDPLSVLMNAVMDEKRKQEKDKLK